MAEKHGTEGATADKISDAAGGAGAGSELKLDETTGGRYAAEQSTLVRRSSEEAGGGGESTAGAQSGAAVQAAQSNVASGDGIRSLLNQHIAQHTGSLKLNWDGKDLKVVGFTSDGQIELENPPNVGGSSYAPLTREHFVYLMSRLF